MPRANNYVAAWVDYDVDKIIVLERDDDGQVTRVRYEPPYYFYVPQEGGVYTSIFGDALAKVEYGSRQEFDAAKRQFPRKFESDIAPIKRVLMENYFGVAPPKVHYAFLDIEVDYSQKLGFAGPNNPYAVINAITIWQSWTSKFLTYAIPPKGWTGTKADIDAELARLIGVGELRENMIPEIRLCGSEDELLSHALADIADADIISGWNSEFFDLPYIAERLLKVGGERALARLDWPGTRLPMRDEVNRFGSPEPIYKLCGRSHLDYMRLFKKFTFEGRSSYSLGNILQEEVGVGKLDYEGTLEQLYNNDFATFVAYNFRDTDGLVQLDEKFKFIALSNQMAHESTVDFQAVLGTVSYVETAITNHAHNTLGKIVHDKRIDDHPKVEGAIVLTPTPAMHNWIGSVDINSLYPNTIRSLNISPEMIVGQFEDGENAWQDITKGNEHRHTLILESGEQHICSASEWKIILEDRSWALSAYGTVFDQGNGRGVVADILGFWYDERKRLQAEKKKWTKALKSLEEGTPEYAEAKKHEEQFDLLQLTKKISMNSLYGALLNAAFRFGDIRMGGSVTATGRAITTHMIENIEELATGTRKKYVKVRGVEKIAGNGDTYNGWHYITQRRQVEVLRDAGELADENYQLPADFVDFESVIYGDTDSCYFKLLKAVDKETAIQFADGWADKTNNSFPAFMRAAFNCQPGFDDKIKAGREVVAIRGLFQAKKKYMLKVVDLEGFAVDKMKSQGSEIKKSDTPKIIQIFLKKTVDMILDGDDYEVVVEYVNGQRREIMKKRDNVFLLGIAKQVNNLDKFAAEYNNPGTMFTDEGRSLTVPGHVRAALNYNALLETFDPGSKAVRSGDKVLVFYLKPNEFKFKAIGLPAELTRFPKWFTENFAVDVKQTEEKMFDSKLRGIFDALGKDVPSPQNSLTNKLMEF